MDELEKELHVIDQPAVEEAPAPFESHGKADLPLFSQYPNLKRLLGVAGVSALSTLVVIGATGLFVWTHRARLAHALFGSDVPAPLAASSTDSPASSIYPPVSLQPKDLSVTDVVAKVNPSVVSIEVSQTSSTVFVNPFGDLFPGFSMPQQQTTPEPHVIGGGSGFFVSSDGLVVTNRHVVDFDNATFVVITSNGKRYNATLVAKDPVLDVALLKVQGSGFPSVTLGNSDNLELGQSVVAIGYALGEFKNSISVGVISGLSRSITAGDDNGSSEQLDKVIQTDAAINPGNSGGPLLNLQGQVIGIDVATAQQGQNVSFAIPINSVKSAIDSVKRTGTIVRPYVGIQYSQITQSTTISGGRTVDHGVLVQAVLASSPAESAGLVPGDVILSIDGTTIDTDTSFANIIRAKSVGQTITLRVLGKTGIERSVGLTLAQAPDS